MVLLNDQLCVRAMHTRQFVPTLNAAAAASTATPLAFTVGNNGSLVFVLM